MSTKEKAKPVHAEMMTDKQRPRQKITIAEARRKALEASEKAQRAQIAYAEDEAARSYDYKVDG